MRGVVQCGSCVRHGVFRRCVRCLKRTCVDCKAPGSDNRTGVRQPLVCGACARGEAA